MKLNREYRKARKEGYRQEEGWPCGRFEAEHWSILYWYERMMEGDGEEILSGLADEEVPLYMEESSSALEFLLDEEEKAMFRSSLHYGWMANPIKAILSWTDSGFYSLSYKEVLPEEVTAQQIHMDRYGSED